MITVPHFNGKGCRPYIEVVEIKNELTTIFSAKDHPNLKKYSDETIAKAKGLYALPLEHIGLDSYDPT